MFAFVYTIHMALQRAHNTEQLTTNDKKMAMAPSWIPPPPRAEEMRIFVAYWIIIPWWNLNNQKLFYMYPAVADTPAECYSLFVNSQHSLLTLNYSCVYDAPNLCLIEINSPTWEGTHNLKECFKTCIISCVTTSSINYLNFCRLTDKLLN